MSTNSMLNVLKTSFNDPVHHLYDNGITTPSTANKIKEKSLT